MSKEILIKLLQSGPNSGPYVITTQLGEVIKDNISKKELINGILININSTINYLVIESLSNCKFKKLVKLEDFNMITYSSSKYKEVRTGCIWSHLTNIEEYNYYYGKIAPYIIEYPFAYSFQDQLLQNVKDYTKAFVYNPIPGFKMDSSNRIEVDDKWFNKAILYNGQQSSGILNLVPKPKNNLQQYMSYPILNNDSKTILFTKSDNFYQYNTFWSLNKSPYSPLFLPSCENLSIDKVINQDNMDYSSRSFTKAPLRAKDLKVRHILDDKKDVHLVSQFILTPSQISYK